jgi:hypothetical protein
MPPNDRSTETDIAVAVMRYLATLPSGEAQIAQIRRQLPKVIALSDEDREESETRAGEEVWEQQVRNIVSHRDTEGNFIAEGLLSRSPRRLAITPAGRAWLTRKGY